MGPWPGEIGRPQPRVGTQFAKPGVGHRRAEVPARSEVATRRDHGDDPPGAVPRIAEPAGVRCPGRSCGRRADRAARNPRRRSPARRAAIIREIAVRIVPGAIPNSSASRGADVAARRGDRQPEQHGQDQRPGVERSDPEVAHDDRRYLLQRLIVVIADCRMGGDANGAGPHGGRRRDSADDGSGSCGVARCAADGSTHGQGRGPPAVARRTASHPDGPQRRGGGRRCRCRPTASSSPPQSSTPGGRGWRRSCGWAAAMRCSTSSPTRPPTDCCSPIAR